MWSARSSSVTIPVVLTNDANAAALGEMLFGAAKGMKDFIVITLGTGVGSGIVSNGEMIYGHDGFAGEIGGPIVDYNGRPCGCGAAGADLGNICVGKRNTPDCRRTRAHNYIAK